jgi:predicted MFS family arabinose efflux permease
MTFLSVIFAILCAAAEDYNTFMAARILNGFFSATCQASGLMIIKGTYCSSCLALSQLA